MIVRGSLMNGSVLAWRVARSVRWAVWLLVIAVAVYSLIERDTLFTPFGRLKPSVELLLFGVGIAPIVVGLFEMMLRDRAGVPRTPDDAGKLVLEQRRERRLTRRPQPVQRPVSVVQERAA